jgi:hypothetical protein
MPGAAERKKHIDAVIDVFTHGYAT